MLLQKPFFQCVCVLVVQIASMKFFYSMRELEDTVFDKSLLLP